MTKHGETRDDLAMEISATTNPLTLFEAWMKEARADNRIKEPTAMALATARSLEDIHVRVVLCKEWSPAGFTFYTNYDSRKGRDLAKNPNAAAVFYWDPLFRQVKISGAIRKTTRAESEAYWNSRARDSQLSQYVSHQSEEVASRQELEALWANADAQFKNQPIPCPPHWGGYSLQPREYEFWVGRHGRLHDRYVFENSGANWTFRRLCP